MGSKIHFSWAPSRLRYTCHIIKCEIQSTVWWKGQDFIPMEIIYFFSSPLSSRLLSCHLDEWLIRQSVKRIMIWLGRGGAGESRGGGVRASKAAWCGGRGAHIGWYNTGQEESILLTVKIHLVRTKHSNRPELSNRPYLRPVLSGWGGFSLKTLYLFLCLNEDQWYW